ncbi:fimbrial protein [Serratia marcescens]|uniref:fimbrial protein n=1 Tax=Serratia marcescens TaxID=615 RepID=UPI000A3B1F5D|nr:fimbrial protein [Serratia marcescens]MBH3072755.1 fimbrial protein [Serratia marcescens]OUI68984.1 hypothetical protein AZZ99_003275 [Serratia marcescens]HEJ0329747.1 fimbrial protein [Serratia marcescens]
MVVLRHLPVLGLCCWFVLGGGMALAADNMSFKGTLIEQGPCQLDRDSKLEINFGDIQIDEVDGKNYTKVASFWWRCDQNPGKTLMVRHLGTAASFDNAAVQTNIANFAIHTVVTTNKTYMQPFVIGEAVLVDDKPPQGNNSLIIINATPVKRPGADLQPGDFSAISTLQLEYQ